MCSGASIRSPGPNCFCEPPHLNEETLAPVAVTPGSGGFHSLSLVREPGFYRSVHTTLALKIYTSQTDSSVTHSLYSLMTNSRSF